MRRRDAIKLRDGDRVTLRATGEACTVRRSYRRENDPRVIMIEILSPSRGTLVVDNTAIA